MAGTRYSLAALTWWVDDKVIEDELIFGAAAIEITRCTNDRVEEYSRTGLWGISDVMGIRKNWTSNGVDIHGGWYQSLRSIGSSGSIELRG